MALLYVTYESGAVHVLSFPTVFLRALHMIVLAPQPVTLRIPEAA
jgi:hypothetical protein